MIRIFILFWSLLISGLLSSTYAWSTGPTAQVRFSNIIEIPIIITHIIPQDHVTFDQFFIEDQSILLGLDQDFLNENAISGNNSLNRGMLMGEISATGDNQDIWKPSEFDKTKNTFRARSLYIIEYNIGTETFSVQKNDPDCYIKQAGLGHLFERGTSMTPTLPNLASGTITEFHPTAFEVDPDMDNPNIVGPFDNFSLSILPNNGGPNEPPTEYTYTYTYTGGFAPINLPTRTGVGCYRQSEYLGDNTCLTADANIDPGLDAPKALFFAPAAFDKAEGAELGDFLTKELFYPKGMTNVRIRMENNLPAVSFKLDVNWSFDIELDFRGYRDNPRKIPTYKVNGKHDLFPLYAVHIGDQLVYGFDGVKAGKDALSLAAPFMTDIENAPSAGRIGPSSFSGDINLPIDRLIRKVNLNPNDTSCK